MPEITLPGETGALSSYRLRGQPLADARPVAPFNRIAYSAAHVVANPRAEGSPNGPASVDWDRTIAYRRYLAGLGLGIAEAMDTAQRGMGLDWPTALELIRHTISETSDIADINVASGCGTDHLPPADTRHTDDVVAAYLEQMHAIQRTGGRVILMSSRALARVGRSGADYQTVYRKVLSEAEKPVI